MTSSKPRRPEPATVRCPAPAVAQGNSVLSIRLRRFFPSFPRTRESSRHTTSCELPYKPATVGAVRHRARGQPGGEGAGGSLSDAALRSPAEGTGADGGGESASADRPDLARRDRRHLPGTLPRERTASLRLLVTPHVSAQWLRIGSSSSLALGSGPGIDSLSPCGNRFITLETILRSRLVISENQHVGRFGVLDFRFTLEINRIIISNQLTR